ncbi:MAG: ABC-F type ribosomal protection protein [Desulfobacterales bacterium]|nr:ABC-F type ribosomal protection protein [Desulfobacterales bacterium]
MNHIKLTHIEKSYMDNPILKDISLDINKNDRLGLVGRNGSGKSTLFNIIAGCIKPDSGYRITDKDTKVGYLTQFSDYQDNTPANDVLYGAYDHLDQLKKKMSMLEEKMANNSPDQVEKLICEYGEIQSVFEQEDGYQVETKIAQICSGLNISKQLRFEKFHRLSGGEKTIVLLARTLTASCNLLLLDEPTNHLDMGSVEWLENFILEFKGTVMIISHDRYFLDKTVKKIIELEHGEAEVFHGNYSDYMEEKEERQQALLNQYNVQEKKIKNMEEAINRFKDWGSRPGSSGDKMFKKAANMEKRIEKIKKFDKPNLKSNKMKIISNENIRSGKDVVQFIHVSKAFNEIFLYKALNCHIRYKERIAILGKNGTGKSTVLKMILGQLNPDGGEVKVGANVNIGYLAQELNFKDESRSVLEEFQSDFGAEQGKARSYLSRFLFQKEDVFKRIGDLSGGEKVRLKICQLMYKSINLLILDEPTNHLDIESREVFEKTLEDFQGTIIFVSHDRYFINRIAQRVLALENGRFIDYQGNYDVYKEQIVKQKSTVKKHENMSENKKDNVGIKEIRKNIFNEKRKLQNQYIQIENSILSVEHKIRTIVQEMEACSLDYKKQEDLYEKKSGFESELDKLLETLIGVEEKLSVLIKA